MLSDLVFHHIGIATNSIINTRRYYLDANYEATEMIFDPLQSVNICFITKPGFPCIELVEPISAQSPVANILNKVGVAPYHFCYVINDIYEGISRLKTKKFIPLYKPLPAIALGNRLICFLYNKDFGLIELLQSK
jgi:methylmalonyl-CoA/ethylmalonyl-CoA epimerase